MSKMALKWYIFIALPLLSWGTQAKGVKGCYIELSPPLPSYVLGEPLYSQDIPTYFDWRNYTSLSPPTNQFLPSPCGSCWAHASVGALTDRMIIVAEKASNHIPITPLSPQVLLDCKDENLGTCRGGSALGAYAFIKDNGITDVTCSPYEGVDDNYWAELSCDQIMCRYCDRFGTCKFVNGTKYQISEYGSVIGESQMKAEIYSRGPIACSVYAHSKPFDEYSGGVIQDPMTYNHTTHVVAIVGWGEEQSGLKYWIGRNSYGTTWGEGGWFRLQRGVNALDIEAHTCAWAIPQ